MTVKPPKLFIDGGLGQNDDDPFARGESITNFCISGSIIMKILQNVTIQTHLRCTKLQHLHIVSWVNFLREFDELY